MTRACTSLIAAVVVAGCMLASASERSLAAVSVGMSDPDPATFADPLFTKLGIRHTRGFTPWNVALVPNEAQYLDAWLAATQAADTEPLITFTASGSNRCPLRPCRPPSVRAYASAFRAFHRRWPQVRVVSPWNEANHRAQPTFKHPKRAAQYYNVVRKRCRGCEIVAADVLDDTNMERWLRVFTRYAHKPRLWGLHNYRDINPRKGQRYGGTRRMLRAVRGDVWLTETGGIVKFVLPNGHPLFAPSESRADRATRRMLALAKRYRRRIKRVYIYHWRQPIGESRFDAGLIRADGTPRPAYDTLARTLASDSAFTP
jgi:hypothetical protein